MRAEVSGNPTSGLTRARTVTGTIRPGCSKLWARPAPMAGAYSAAGDGSETYEFDYD